MANRATLLALSALVATLAIVACSAPAPPPQPDSKLPQPPGLAAPVAGVTAQALTGDGGTYPGPYFVGRPDAPVRVDEFSDFQ